MNGMDIARPVGSTIESVGFATLSANEVRKLSVKQISNPQLFDNLGHPVPGGLYDLALGAFSPNCCATCGLNHVLCLGHLGHIELPIPLYHPLFFNHMYLLLRSACLHCGHFRLHVQTSQLYELKLRLLLYGLVAECSVLQDITGKASKDDEGYENDTAATMKLRQDFVDRAISEAIALGRTVPEGIRTPSLLAERKALITDLYHNLISRTRCQNCKMYSPRFRKEGVVKIFEIELGSRNAKANGGMSTNPGRNSGVVDEEKEVKIKSNNGSRYLLNQEVYNIISKLLETEQGLAKTVFCSDPSNKDPILPEIFFTRCLAVPPTRFRAPNRLGEDMTSHPINDLFVRILEPVAMINDLNHELYEMRMNKQGADERKARFAQLVNQLLVLQSTYNALIDTTKSTQRSKTPIPGIKQMLEKKEGLFRMNMMGKRVNYAARSVISPDPNIETNEIGIPLVFALGLTYPEPVTPHNFEELRQAVIRGPKEWPGATMIQNETGQFISLANLTIEQRTGLANQLQAPTNPGAGLLRDVGVFKKVYRHIRDGDVVLMNRQPTLHKASMMGHKVRVLRKENTLRLHYANTGAYNADFDGDEMNLHFLQNEVARSEAMHLANTNSQYLTPTSGKPLRGLIQDHISAGVWLTNKDTFFSREEYQQLIYSSIQAESEHLATGRIQILPPAIFKPECRWTGKQVISTILLNLKPLNREGLNLESKNKIKNDYWGASSEENTVIFKNGELLCGVLDKSQYGAAEYGMVHAIYEIHGSDAAGKLLSVLGRLFSRYIISTAFTCGIDDLRLTRRGDDLRNGLLEAAKKVGLESACEVTNLPKSTKSTDSELLVRLEEVSRDNDKSAILDAVSQSKANALTSKIVSACIPDETEKKFPYNSMQAMALSGAKGSGVNVSQIMCALGQQVLEGRRVPVMVSGKTLPSFKPFETNIRAGGYIAGRFYSGIKPQEYFFHCMAGREGLIDTAVKTSRSGYLQRCLMKALEGVRTEYDNTVRDSDGTLIEYMYGGDCIDTTKASYLEQFDFCAANFESLVDKHSPKVASEIDAVKALEYNKKVRKHLKKHPGSTKYNLILSEFNPARSVGAVSEKFQSDLNRYIELKKQELKKNGIDRKKFESLMLLKYQQSLVDPGECVGVIAAQSIGEPSTQMTLNTFHFAGHGAANVTLGIPRMREIIMVASRNIKTPQMILPIREEVTDETADVFCRGIMRIMLSEVIDKVVVTEQIGRSEHHRYVRSYKVRLNFFPREEYENEYDMTSAQLEKVINFNFLDMLERAILKERKKQDRVNISIGEAVKLKEKDETAIEESEESKAVGTGEDRESHTDKSAKAYGLDAEDDEDVDDDDNADDDMDDNESAKKPVKEGTSYDQKEPEDEEEESEEERILNEDNEEKSDWNSEFTESNSQSEFRESSTDAEETRRRINSVAFQREQSVVNRYNSVTSFSYDANGEWCEFELMYDASLRKLLIVNLIEDVCRNVVVKEVPGISRCLRATNQQLGRVFVTEGVNFHAMWDEYLFIDVNKIMSNDIYAVLQTYGVEAARLTIVREISSVFETYAISVNTRHLELIADMMTREGTFLPFSRQGLEFNTSPFLKMSFESTCSFLTKTVVDRATDPLKTPSARLVVGRPMSGGTGSFDVFNMPLGIQA